MSTPETKKYSECSVERRRGEKFRWTSPGAFAILSDLTAPELDVYARLTEAQLRNRLEPDKGVFIAESPKVIATALDAGYEPLSLLMERRHIEGDAQPILARCGEIPVYTAERETLARLTGFELTRGVLCAMRRPRLPSVEEVCARARRVAVLEGIVDHTNVGADNSVSIDDAQLAAEPRLAIVLGTEGDGLSPRTIAACDYTVKIPMAHGVDSLNVAAASAVAFWQLRTK